VEANQVMQLLAGDQSQSKPDPSWAEHQSVVIRMNQVGTRSGESEAATARWAELFNMEPRLFRLS